MRKRARGYAISQEAVSLVDQLAHGRGRLNVDSALDRLAKLFQEPAPGDDYDGGVVRSKRPKYSSKRSTSSQ